MQRENPRVLSASTLIGDKVRNRQGEDLGKIEEFMIDLQSGCVSYAVLSFGGIMGIGDKLFAVPWKSLTVDTKAKEIILDVPKERLEKAPGFNKDDWPDFADQTWGTEVHKFYNAEPYWKAR